MAYPTDLDNFTAQVDGETIMAADVNELQTAIEAIETKVGVDSSAVATSIDYLVKSTSSSNPGHKHTLADGATDVTASVAELNYVDGVTSAIQTQLDAKAPSISPTFATSITGSYLTASEILITDGSKNIVSAAVATYPSLTELTYVKGLTSAAQTQITAKVTSGGALGTPSSGTGTNITGIPAANILAGSLGAGAYVISTSLQAATIELSHATENTLSASSGVLSIEGVAIPTISSTSTLTNKRITERVVTTTDDATAVIDVDVTDTYQLSAVANNTEFTVTGTPTDGQKLIVRYKDAGVSKTLTWTFATALGITLPTATTAGKWGYVGCIYNSAASQWHAVAVTTQA